MTAPNPADELRAAATKLRELAEAAQPGTWTAEELPPNEHHKHPAHWVKAHHEDDTSTSSLVVADCPWRQADAAYIAAMHPAVGSALADWLGHEAESLTAAQRKYPDMPTDIPGLAPALAVARAINQQQEEQS